MVLIGVVGQSPCSCGGHLLMLLFSKHCARIAFLLVSQASGLTLLAPGSQSSEPGVEGAASKPQEDGMCCRHALCQGSVFGHPLFEFDALVQKAVAKSSLLVFTSSLLVKKLLTTSSLLSMMSCLLIEKALAGCCLEVMALVLP
jgi:hypothetical protein